MEKRRMECPALPAGWKKEEVIRKSGLSAGKSDVYYFSPSGKKFRSKPQLARYLGNSMDLSCFDFRTGKMMPSKMQKSKQRMRHDPLNQAKAKPDLNTTLPIRQTASIFKQPVTKITQHPNNKVKSDPQRVIDQPRQLFWEKRLEGMCALDVTEQVIKPMELPKGLQGVGPGNNEETLLSAIASALHTSSAPITGQLSAAVEKNPSVWLNTSQPLCKAFIVTDEDISSYKRLLASEQKPVIAEGQSAPGWMGGKLFATKDYVEGLLPENYGHIHKPGTPRKPEGNSLQPKIALRDYFQKTMATSTSLVRLESLRKQEERVQNLRKRLEDVLMADILARAAETANTELAIET